METVRSKDGTVIAYDKVGQGPPLILVDGALCYRVSGPMRSLASQLAPHFTVYFYDRRGRGDSGDTKPWAVEREIEDIEALIAAAGGSAYVFGLSSGAALSLEAASRGLSIRKLALYEAPFVVDGTYPPMTDKYLPDLKALVAADRRGDAVKHFLRRVGVPGVFIALMRFMPSWKRLTAVAPTLVYDISIVEPNQKGRALTTSQWTIKVPDARRRRRQEPGMDAQWHARARWCAADLVVHDPRWPDAHGEVRGAGASADGVLQQRRRRSVAAQL